MTAIEVRNLGVEYEQAGANVQAVRNVSFDIEENTIVGLLGESGCGKSTLAGALIEHLPANAQILEGEVRLNGENVLAMSEAERRNILWNEIAYIPQNAMNCLDPVVTLREQLVEPVLIHTSKSRKEAIQRAKEVLEIVGIDLSHLDAYPHQLSGGMKQRIVVAMALLLDPKLIIADEPTTGLDVLVRDRILNDLERFRDDFDVSILIISHDIADLIETSDSLLVMYAGKIVEKGPSRTLFKNPTHPYTIALQNALPNINSSIEELITMEMDPPDLRSPPDGCCFINRCPYAKSECEKSHPSFHEVEPGIESACYRASEANTLRDQAAQMIWTNEKESETTAD